MQTHAPRSVQRVVQQHLPMLPVHQVQGCCQAQEVCMAATVEQVLPLALVQELEPLKEQGGVGGRQGAMLVVQQSMADNDHRRMLSWEVPLARPLPTTSFPEPAHMHKPDLTCRRVCVSRNGMCWTRHGRARVP